jgi:hypothetical protein
MDAAPALSWRDRWTVDVEDRFVWHDSGVRFSFLWTDVDEDEYDWLLLPPEGVAYQQFEEGLRQALGPQQCALWLADLAAQATEVWRQAVGMNPGILAPTAPPPRPAPNPSQFELI